MSDKSEQPAEQSLEGTGATDSSTEEANTVVVEKATAEENLENMQTEDSTPDPGNEKSAKEKSTDKSPKPHRGFPWFGLFNLLLILCLSAALAYYWVLQQKTEAEKQVAFEALKQQVSSKAESAQIDQIQSSLRPFESGLAENAGRIEQLQQHQKDLQDSSIKLYELFGRDENGWQLAEVEYLMRIAQHKLILENDFEGAAVTLQAASDRIATTGDLGLLPVRVKISDEIAELKTRRRADLVGMTLKLSQLSQQIRGLTPGFQPVLKNTVDTVSEVQDLQSEEASFTEQAKSYLASLANSLVSVKRDSQAPPTQTEALIINVGEKLEDNLILTRWAVLERDAFQYRRLMKENIELFEQFYNLDDAANHDFIYQLRELRKAEIKPEKPDINGSLEMLKKIISKRDDAENEAANEEADNV